MIPPSPGIIPAGERVLDTLAHEKTLHTGSDSATFFVLLPLPVDELMRGRLMGCLAFCPL